MRQLLCLFSLLFLADPGVARADDPKEKPKAAFRTAPVTRGSVTASVRATGTLEPEEVVDVGAQVTGMIAEFGTDPARPGKTIDYGSPVDVGTVLARIDPALYQAQVEQAKAKLERARASIRLLEARAQQAERDSTRLKKLGTAVSAEDREVAQSRLDVARADLDVGKADALLAEAGLKQAEVNLGYTIIKSPIKGVVIDRRVNVGQTVTAALNAPSLFLIARDLKRLQCWASVKEADIGQIQVGQPAQFTVDAFPDAVFQCKVSSIRLNASMTQNVVTYTVVLDVDNANGKLLPYLTADVRIVVGEQKEAKLVPSAALRWRPNLEQVTPGAREAFAAWLEDREKGKPAFVWVEEKGFVRPVKVKSGLTDGTVTEIIDGELEERTPVVVGVKSPAQEK
jgi:HlyD family secretion protein